MQAKIHVGDRKPVAGAPQVERSYVAARVCGGRERGGARARAIIGREDGEDAVSDQFEDIAAMCVDR